jgi:hypothetical protein
MLFAKGGEGYTHVLVDIHMPRTKLREERGGGGNGIDREGGDPTPLACEPSDASLRAASKNV